MEIVKTVKAKIVSHTDYLDETIVVYNQALSFLIDVADKEYESLKDLTSKEMMTAFERMIHATKENPTVKYNFDARFHKFPSYLRRSAIYEAFGHMKSHHSRQQNWLDEKAAVENLGKVFRKRPPTLNMNHKSFPALYKGNMFEKLSKDSAFIKIYKNHDWVWLPITFQSKNFDNRDLDKYKELNPSLVKKGRKYFLNIPYERNVKLPEVKSGERVVVGVDLGITNSAVCCAMNANGTVMGRLFVNQPVEKDRLHTVVGKLSRALRQTGIAGQKPNYWRKINGLQDAIINDTVDQIVKFAIKHNAYAIVFENLGNMRVPKGFYGAKKLRFKLQFWAKQAIQNKTSAVALHHGIRTSHVCAKNTSRLAFDGSGEVVRTKRKDLCTFSTGKLYHADLSASYNIAARYHIRNTLETLSESRRLQVQAKVPGLAKRTTCVLATLISMREVI